MVSIDHLNENKETAPMPGSAATTSGLDDKAKWAV